LLTQGTNVYTWDAANRLVSANGDGVVSSFEYDGSGNRTAQTVGGVTTEYVLDVAGGPSAALRASLPEVIVATTGGASAQYAQVQGQILAEYEAGAWEYILPDHLPAPGAKAQVGSVRQLTDAAGQVTLAQCYDPFGVLISQFPSLPTFWLHTPAGHRPASGGMPRRRALAAGIMISGGYGCPGSH
jgi:YD repeat-containing protein